MFFLWSHYTQNHNVSCINLSWACKTDFSWHTIWYSSACNMNRSWIFSESSFAAFKASFNSDRSLLNAANWLDWVRFSWFSLLLSFWSCWWSFLLCSNCANIVLFSVSFLAYSHWSVCRVLSVSAFVFKRPFLSYLVISFVSLNKTRREISSTTWY